MSQPPRPTREPAPPTPEPEPTPAPPAPTPAAKAEAKLDEAPEGGVYLTAEGTRVNAWGEEI